jgi:hypothetical protein
VSPKWSTSDRATIRAAYIGGIAVVAAAVIGLVAAFLATSSSGSKPPSAQDSPSTAPRVTTSPESSASVAASAHGRTWKETTFSQSKTFADYVNAGDPQGARLRPRQAVQVSCRVRGLKVKDGDPWWYRLASPPWNGQYYATSDVFYNTPNTSGSGINGVVVDTRVRLC